MKDPTLTSICSTNDRGMQYGVSTIDIDTNHASKGEESGHSLVLESVPLSSSNAAGGINTLTP